MSKALSDWTRKELLELPRRKWNENIGEFNSLIIIPTRRIHDSGYRCMDFVSVLNGEPTYLLSGCSDVIHIEGIGGLAHNWIQKGGVHELVTPTDWSIDCLKKSGLLHIFCHKKIIAGEALSSFEIFSIKD